MDENQAAKKPMTKTEIYAALSETTGLTKEQVSALFDELAKLIGKNLGNDGPGVFGRDHNIVNSASWAAREGKLEPAQGVGAGRPRPGDRGPVVHAARRDVRGRSGSGRRASNQGNRGWGRAPKNRSAAVVRSGRSARKLCSTRKAFSFRAVSR